MHAVGPDERESRIARWNERYRAREDTRGFVPSPPLPQALRDHAPVPGLALDLACGAGRHALYLAGLGWQVVAVDAAEEGVRILREEARARGQELAGRIQTHVADLMTQPPGFELRPDTYDLVLDLYFLERALFPAIRAAARPGGLLVAAIHVGPEPTARLLAPGELHELVAGWGWTILAEHEGASPEPGHKHDTAWIVARRPGRAAALVAERAAAR